MHEENGNRTATTWELVRAHWKKFAVGVAAVSLLVSGPGIIKNISNNIKEVQLAKTETQNRDSATIVSPSGAELHIEYAPDQDDKREIVGKGKGKEGDDKKKSEHIVDDDHPNHESIEGIISEYNRSNEAINSENNRSAEEINAENNRSAEEINKEDNRSAEELAKTEVERIKAQEKANEIVLQNFIYQSLADPMKFELDNNGNLVPTSWFQSGLDDGKYLFAGEVLSLDSIRTVGGVASGMFKIGDRLVPFTYTITQN